jgi:hypothetical protein
MAYARRQGAKRQDFLKSYFTELFRLCGLLNFDFAILVAQSDNETDSWRSAAWQTYGNPAGLAITNSENKSLVYKSGTDAARAHVVHMYGYRFGRVPASHLLYPYIALDGHYKELFASDALDTRGDPLAGSVRTVGDFNVNGRWALLDRINTPKGPLDDYGNRIVENGQAVWGDTLAAQTNVEGDTLPDTRKYKIVFGRVPKPAIINRIITNSQAWSNQGIRTIRGVVWHRMYGTLWGTDGYFRGEAIAKSLTDFGVGVLAVDGAANAGKILQWNSLTGNRSPYASGPVENPIGDAAKFLQTWDYVNRDLASIEISGDGNTPLDPESREAVIEITAWLADDYKVSFEDWPYVPNENKRSFVLWHGEIYAGKRDTCPGAVVEAETNDMMDAVQARLEKYQKVWVDDAGNELPDDGTTPPPVITPPDTPPPVITPGGPQPVPGLAGVDMDLLAAWFGDITVNKVRYRFDPNGPVSLAWMAYGKTTGIWPKLETVEVYENGARKFYRFAGGLTIRYLKGASPEVSVLKAA